RAHPAAAVAPQVQDRAAGPGQTGLQLPVELLLGAVAELVDPEIEDVARQARGLHARALEALASHRHLDLPGVAGHQQRDRTPVRAPDQGRRLVRGQPMRVLLVDAEYGVARPEARTKRRRVGEDPGDHGVSMLEGDADADHAVVPAGETVLQDSILL